MGQGAVGGEARDPEVDVSVGDVSIAVLDERPDHLDHLRDVLGSARIVLGPLGAERRHVLEERRGVRRDVFVDRDPRVHRLVENAVVDVGQVHHVRDAKASDPQMSPHKVVKEECSKVADVSEVPDRRTARIHADVALLERLEILLRSGERVVQP